MRGEPYLSEMKPNMAVILMIAVTVVLSLIPGLMFFAWGFPLLIYFFEIKSDMVKKYARQFAAAYLTYAVIQLVLAIITLITYIVYGVVAGLAFYHGFDLLTFNLGELILTILGALTIAAYVASSILTAIKVYRYEECKMPVVLGFANNAVDSIIKKIEEALEKKRNKE